MLQHQEARLFRQTPVYDHAGELLYRATREKAQQLLGQADVHVRRTKHRIVAFQYLGPDPAHRMGGSHHKRGIGTPHRNESYWNVRGCWHIDRIPSTYQPHFVAIVTDRLVVV